MKTIYACIAIILLMSFTLGCSDENSYSPEEFIGSWVTSPTPHPGTTTYHFNTNGTYDEYKDYNMTNLDASGAWSVSGSVMTLSNSIIELPFTISKSGEDQFSLSIGFISQNYYRLGSVPYAQNTNTAVHLPVGNSYTSNYISQNDSQWFYFSATNTYGYLVFVDDKDGTGNYTGDAKITVFHEDLTKIYCTQLDRDLDNSPLSTGMITGDCRIYIVVEKGDWSADDLSGGYGISVETL